MEATSCQKYIRTAPRKLRRLADSLKGKSVIEAESILKWSPSTSSKELFKAIHSAASNLKNKIGAEAESKENFLVSCIQIDQGPVLKRIKRRARGHADIMRRRTSHITVTVKGE